MTSESDTMIRLPILRDLTFREWHGFVNGFYKGLVEGGRQHEYEKEKHYWRGGYSLGFVIRYGIIILVLSQTG